MLVFLHSSTELRSFLTPLDLQSFYNPYQLKNTYTLQIVIKKLIDQYPNGFLKQYILPSLPIVFNNTAVTIYQVPDISAPSVSSDLAIVSAAVRTKFIGSDWRLRTESGTINNLTHSSVNGGVELTGYLNSTVRDYYLFDQPITNIKTDDYPEIIIRWRSSQSCALFEVKYSDGTYLSDYTGTGAISANLPNWAVTSINQPSNKTISYIILGIDDRFSPFVGGLQTVSIDYIALKSSQNNQDSLSTISLASTGLEYSLSSDMDPNLSQYSKLLLSSDVAIYDLSDDFSNNLSQWSVITGNWSIVSNRLQLNQITPYVDAMITAGSSSWADYSVSVEAESIGKLSDDVCLQFRYQDSKNAYDFRMQSNVLRLGKFVNGSWSELAKTADYKMTGDTWYKLGITVKGNDILCYLNDQLVFNVVDNSYSQGGIALRAEGITATFDNMTVQTDDRLALLNRYIDAIKSGSNVVVLSDEDFGYFASLMKLDFANSTTVDCIKYGNMTISTPATNTPTLYSNAAAQQLGAYYSESINASAFALSIPIGSGKLTYINYAPIQSMIDNSPTNLKWALLSKIGSLIGQIANASNAVQTFSDWTYAVAEGMTLNGEVNIKTVQLPFSPTNIQTDNIIITPANPSNKPTVIANATITNLKVQGITRSIINADNTELSTFSSESCTAFDFTEGCQWTTELYGNASVDITYSYGTFSHTVTAKAGTINIQSPHAILLTNTPNVSVNGQTLFHKAYVGWIGSSDKVPSEGQQFTIMGNATFTIDCVDGTSALISGLNYDGMAHIPSSPTVSWNELDIPWFTILTSPYHLLFLFSIIATPIAWYVRKKLRIPKKLRARNV